MRKLLLSLAAMLLGLTCLALGAPQIAGLSPPVAHLAIIQADVGNLAVPIGIASSAAIGMLLLAAIAQSLPTTEKLGSRLRISFAMLAFARAVTPMLDLVSAAHKNRQRAMARIDLISEIPRKVIVAMKPTEFGHRQAHSRIELAVSTN